MAKPLVFRAACTEVEEFSGYVEDTGTPIRETHSQATSNSVIGEEPETTLVV